MYVRTSLLRPWTYSLPTRVGWRPAVEEPGRLRLVSLPGPERLEDHKFFSTFRSENFYVSEWTFIHYIILKLYKWLILHLQNFNKHSVSFRQSVDLNPEPVGQFPNTLLAINSPVMCRRSSPRTRGGIDGPDTTLSSTRTGLSLTYRARLRKRGRESGRRRRREKRETSVSTENGPSRRNRRSSFPFERPRLKVGWEQRSSTISTFHFYYLLYSVFLLS